MENGIKNLPPLPPTVFVIFGATGDLFRKKLLPSLAHLHAKNLLPEKFEIFAVARKPFGNDEFRKLAWEFIGEKSADRENFLDRLSYHQGLFDDDKTYTALGQRLLDFDTKVGKCSNKLFYLAVPPTLYDLILEKLKKSGLTIPCGNGEGWTRILIEKPFGKNAETARALDQKLGKLFEEEQIFRIDHYLAKETIQNILTFRFGNAIFEPLWNKKYIKSISINLFEKDGLNGRGTFYDGIGALRDVGQNHLLSMLSLIAMDEPKSWGAHSVRKNRAAILRKLVKIKARDIKNFTFRGQYEGYLSETGVAADSKTETSFAITAFVGNSRWRNVPFYLRSGKAFPNSKTEIEICFKNPDDTRSPEKSGAVASRSNLLKFKIQPEEAISMNFWAKKTGFGNEIEKKELAFSYGENGFSKEAPGAYERVLLDAIRGDQTLFASTEEIEASWKFISPILENWENAPLETYKQGVPPHWRF